MARTKITRADRVRWQMKDRLASWLGNELADNVKSFAEVAEVTGFAADLLAKYKAKSAPDFWAVHEEVENRLDRGEDIITALSEGRDFAEWHAERDALTDFLYSLGRAFEEDTVGGFTWIDEVTLRIATMDGCSAVTFRFQRDSSECVTY